jgi:hypothetical protein
MSGSSLFELSDSDIQEVGADNTILGVLQNFGNRLQDELRHSLQSKIMTITPKGLEQSIVFDINVLGSGYQFELTMNDYWKFIDKGVQGVGGIKKNGGFWLLKNNTSEYRFTDKKPPLSALEPWSNAQGTNPFVVQNSVFRKGIKATNFYSDVVDENLVKDLIKDLEKAGAREVVISLKNSISGNNN